MKIIYDGDVLDEESDGNRYYALALFVLPLALIGKVIAAIVLVPLAIFSCFIPTKEEESE